MFAEKGIGKLIIYLNVCDASPCNVSSWISHRILDDKVEIQKMKNKKLIHYAIFVKNFNLDFNHMYDRFSFNIFPVKRDGNFNQFWEIGDGFISIWEQKEWFQFISQDTRFEEFKDIELFMTLRFLKIIIILLTWSR